ncbi:MAG: hypothetical protein JNL82_27505 [Myxococcales bacterium]|nr:hypothetical protein [Myxococcales bacterium]
MHRFFRDDGRAALTRAVAAFEACTSAELVVSVRARSDGYPLTSAIAGCIGALATTAALLYSEPAFELHWFLVLPLVMGALVGSLARVPALQRLLVLRRTQDARVQAAARALFVERGVADTRGRTGVLLYVSLAERLCAFVVDLGVRERVPQVAWDASTDVIRSHVGRGCAARDLVEPIAALGGVCGRHLPRREDDVNELDDGVMS